MDSILLHNTYISSIVKNDSLLLRQAKKLSQQESVAINNMLSQLSKGNIPGKTPKIVAGNITEFKHGSSARIYARKKGGGWEILGYSGKSNQQKVINRLRELYGR